MTKKTNPFADFDMFKAWTDFDPSKAADQFTKMITDMNMPAFDVEALVDSQRKSAEALNEANQKVLDGVRSVAERQSEIMREAMEKSTAALETMGKAKTPQEAVEKNIEMARKSYDKAVKDMSELGDMITKVNSDAVAPINTRIKEGFVEAKSMTAAASK
ncbi:MAG: phasin family protein [Rhodospirillales bacterium]|jgi:phasin family protein|nr:phasin family protein [Rhodospirillales bacterium]